MQAGSLTAPGRNPSTYALQVFQGNAAFGAFSSLHDRLRDPMVGVFAEPGLLAGQFTETALSRLGASFLKPALARPRDPIPDALDIGSWVCLVPSLSTCKARRYRSPRRSQSAALNSWVSVMSEVAASIHLPRTKHRSTSPLAVGHQPPLLAHHDRDGDTPLDGPEVDCGAILNEADNAIVVGLGCILAEDWRNAAVDLKGICDLGDGTDGRLSGETEPLPHFEGCKPVCAGHTIRRRTFFSKPVAASHVQAPRCSAQASPSGSRPAH